MLLLPDQQAEQKVHTKRETYKAPRGFCTHMNTLMYRFPLSFVTNWVFLVFTPDIVEFFTIFYSKHNHNYQIPKSFYYFLLYYHT